MPRIMAQDRISRGVATFVALGVQGLVLLVLGMGLGILPISQPDAPAMTVALIPQLKPIADSRASIPRVHLHLQDPGLPPPVVPAEIVLPEPVPEPPPQAAVPRTTRSDSTGALGSDSGIGIVSRVEPEYPAAAMLRRSQGTTTVAILVEANGHPGAVRVLHSSGDAQLDEAAIRAVQKWEFAAAMSNSHVIPRWGRLDVNFDLTLYRTEHTDRPAARAQPDPVAALAALVRDPHRLALLGWAVGRLLHDSGPVRSIRFIGVSLRLPQPLAPEDLQELRTLDPGHVDGWNVFEVTQLRGISQWYCAVDAGGRILAIVAQRDER
jgi:TonB family protein